MNNTNVAHKPVEVFGADEAPLIEPGFYEAVGGRARKFKFRKAWKLAVDWRVLVRTPADDVVDVILQRFYNVEEVGGRVRASRHSSYAREWALVAGRRVGRRDRISPHAFEGVLCDVEVETVERDSEQRPLPEHARYSKVARLVALKAGRPRQ